MGVGHESQLHRDLARIFERGSASEDRALLDRFRADGDPEAFEVLVARHGPMVQGVCRRLPAGPHDADDAFQATFLVLVRNAGRLRDADRLGPWLYGVAGRVATKARARQARRRERTPIREGDFAAPGRAEGSLSDPITRPQDCQWALPVRKVASDGVVRAFGVIR